MTDARRVNPIFHVGDEVVLVEGAYQGTLGVFVRFGDDAGWADIKERNGAVRSHPVSWLGHPVGDGRSSARMDARLGPGTR